MTDGQEKIPTDMQNCLSAQLLVQRGDGPGGGLVSLCPCGRKDE